MTSQLMLVIVIVAAGIVLAAVVALRAGKISTHVGRAGASDSSSPNAPASRVPGDPPAASAPPNAAVASAPTRAAAAPPQSDAGALPESANFAAVPAEAGTTRSPNLGINPAAAGTLSDTSDLVFSLAPAGADNTTQPVTPAPRTGTSPIATPAQPATAALSTPTTRAALVAGTTPPEGPQVLQPAEIFTKLFDLALGKARPASSVTAGHHDIEAATGAALLDVATQQRYAPRRPNMLPKVLSASSDDSFSRRDLAALIAQDPSLVGNLLKIANSSYYRVTPEPVESVDRAVVLLGTDGIRSLVTTALMQPIFRIGGADFPRFPEVAWEHTFRSASASVPHNFLLEESDPYAAELLSLVMGLAGIVVFRVAMDQYAKNQRLRPDAGVVASLLDTHSASVARLIGASWELSEPTLAGLDGQTIGTTAYPTALGRSLYYGRVVGALAMLRINHIIDDETAKASIPATKMPEAQLDRMWTRLTPKPDKH
jgi:HD-like signal output (HDOD) protein